MIELLATARYFKVPQFLGFYMKATKQKSSENKKVFTILLACKGEMRLEYLTPISKGALKWQRYLASLSKLIRNRKFFLQEKKRIAGITSFEDFNSGNFELKSVD